VVVGAEVAVPQLQCRPVVRVAPRRENGSFLPHDIPLFVPDLGTEDILGGPDGVVMSMAMLNLGICTTEASTYQL
jgi:hypothetical protein